MNRKQRRQWAKEETKRLKNEERNNHNMEMSKRLGISPEEVDYYSHIPLTHVSVKSLNTHYQYYLNRLKAPFLRWMNWECFHCNLRMRKNIYPSFDDIKAIPRLELDRYFISSYLTSFDNDYKQVDGKTSGINIFRFSIPPFEHGVIRPIDDTVWIEWQLMSLNDNDFDIRFYCWEYSIDKYKDYFKDSIILHSGIPRINENLNYVDIDIDIPEYLLLVYTMTLTARYNPENKMFEFCFDNNSTYSYEEICESYLMMQENAFKANRESEHPVDLSHDEKVLELVRDYYFREVARKADDINDYMKDVAFDNLKYFMAFNYAAEINTKRDVSKNKSHISYNYELTDDATEVKTDAKQLSLSSENGGTARIITSNKTEVLRKLKPIKWTRRGHYRHYKNGKVVYVKPADCHWQKFEESQLTRKQSVVRLTDIFSETSSLERYTSNYLDEKNIDYIPQYSFPDLTGDGNVLRFDFAIKKDDKILALIECQGEQHYHPVDIWGGEKQFKKQQRYDLLKADYADKHGYPLLLMDGRKIKTESDVYSFLDKSIKTYLD